MGQQSKEFRLVPFSVILPNWPTIILESVGTHEYETASAGGFRHFAFVDVKDHGVPTAFHSRIRLTICGMREVSSMPQITRATRIGPA
jgi:hypothetical protein